MRSRGAFSEEKIMAATQRELDYHHVYRRTQHAVRRRRTAARPWHSAECIGDVVLAAALLYVTYLVIALALI
jgi:hypothetical protein